jgi:1-acyl-sn-glycerol-3-phosphate acyltransferase
LKDEQRLVVAVRDPDPAAIEKGAEILRKLRAYSRLEVEGLDKLPSGPCILVANHTGWAGLDYANLFITVYDGVHRAPRVAVHPSYFRVPALRDLGERLGFFEVSVQTSTQILDQKGIVTFFPEAEDGNFKPLWRRYQLQAFKPGFARVALATEAPVVPVVIVGGEDANPSLGKLHVKYDLGEIPIPLPLNLLPLPVKWRIAFLDPVDPARYLSDESPDKDHAEEMARDLRATMQRALDEQVRKRGNPWV